MEKFVKVAKLGSKVQELLLDNGATVASVLAAAGEDAEGYEIRVNGNTVDANTVLSDGDIITLVPSIKGGQVMVKVARLGDRVHEVYLEDGSSAEDALATAGVEAEGYELRVNGSPADPETEVEDGDILTLVPDIKGGS